MKKQFSADGIRPVIKRLFEVNRAVTARLVALGARTGRVAGGPE